MTLALCVQIGWNIWTPYQTKKYTPTPIVLAIPDEPLPVPTVKEPPTPVASVPVPEIKAEVAPEPKHVSPPATPVISAPPIATDVLASHRFYLRLKRSDDSIVTRLGGDVTWRINNLGRVPFDEKSRSLGAIGSYNNLAVFPTEEIGNKAFLTVHANDKLADAFEGRNAARRAVLAHAKTPPDVPLKSLSPEQKDAMFSALKTSAVGYIPGKVMVFEDAADFDANGW